MIVDAGAPLRLVGSPFERGAAQASVRPALNDHVRSTARRRRDETAEAGRMPAVRAYLERQFDFARTHSAGELAELDGIAHGFGLDAREVFDALHASAFGRFAQADGCTAWAAGTMLAKNRDIRGDLRPLQAVMLHVDPAQPMYSVLCVGSLGAPGAYSSGINRAGLAVADTAIDAPSYATGWLRYFLMTRLLWTCATVHEALALVRSTAHTGGGSLVLADALGHAAAVEFHDGSATIDERPQPTRTNHFVAAGAPPPAPAAAESHSAERLEFLRAAMARTGAPTTPAAAAALMASHAGEAALCRHADGAQVRTVSSAIFLTASRELLFSNDYPCGGRFERHALAAHDG